MKKFIAMALAGTMSLCMLTGCNKQVIDLNYNFNKAIISMPNGDIIEGKVDSWNDYEDGDQIQVKINGNTYLVHSSNVVLINE